MGLFHFGVKLFSYKMSLIHSLWFWDLFLVHTWMILCYLVTVFLGLGNLICVVAICMRCFHQYIGLYSHVDRTLMPRISNSKNMLHPLLNYWPAQAQYSDSQEIRSRQGIRLVSNGICSVLKLCFNFELLIYFLLKNIAHFPHNDPFKMSK